MSASIVSVGQYSVTICRFCTSCRMYGIQHQSAYFFCLHMYCLLY